MRRIVLVGNPVSHSLSPTIHNAAFEALGLDDEYQYELLCTEAEDLAGVIASIESGVIEGANVTIPHKTAILEHLSEVSSAAKEIGSVNTLFRENGVVAGCNTDMQGFANSLHKMNFKIKGCQAAVLGAGGAARAVTYALSRNQADSIHLYNRSRLGAEELVSDLSNNSAAELRVHLFPLRNLPEGTNLLVNCTPIGMEGHSPHETPISKEILHDGLMVMDLVYNPLSTRLLRDARETECATIDGTHMLVEQAALSFMKWTGVSPPIHVMEKCLLNALEVIPP